MRRDDPTPDEAFDDNMHAILDRMRESGITPYGSDCCIYRSQKIHLEIISMMLRDLGHVAAADYMDAEMMRISQIPGMKTDVLFCVQAISDQTGLCLDIWKYCKKRPELIPVINCHHRFGPKGPEHE